MQVAISLLSLVDRVCWHNKPMCQVNRFQSTQKTSPGLEDTSTGLRLVGDILGKYGPNLHRILEQVALLGIGRVAWTASGVIRTEFWGPPNSKTTKIYCVHSHESMTNVCSTLYFTIDPLDLIFMDLPV